MPTTLDAGSFTLLLVVGVLTRVACAQPANDNFVNAISITPAAFDTRLILPAVSNAGATSEAGEPAKPTNGVPFHRSVWWQVVVPVGATSVQVSHRECVRYQLTPWAEVGPWALH